MRETLDVVIIGAGPAGLAAAVYTGRARLNTLILEKGMPGGQILLTDLVENYPGFPEGVVPFQLMEDFRKHAEKFGAKIETDEAKKIQKQGDLWHVSGVKGEYPTRAVIIATGSVYRKLGLPGEAKLTGRGVSYCATCDGAFFKDKEVAVVGGGDNALTEALFLTKFCRAVKVIHRRDQFLKEYSPQALLTTIKKALSCYEKPDHWQKIMKAGLRENFSWDAAARKYTRLYQNALEIKRGG